MPGFGAWAPLTTSLVAEHGMPRDDFIATDKADAAVGRMLVGLEVDASRHGVGDEPPMAAFEAVGVNFAQSAERLVPAGTTAGWTILAHHTINPNARYADPVTGKAVRPDILDGNATAQFDIAAWLANAPSPALPMNTTSMTRTRTNTTTSDLTPPREEKSKCQDQRWAPPPSRNHPLPHLRTAPVHRGPMVDALDADH